MDILKNIFASVLNIFFPPRCPMCGCIVKKDGQICSGCKPDVYTVEPPVCKKCGMNRKICTCASDNHIFEANVSKYYYYGAVKRGVRRYKFKNKPSSSRFFINAAAQKAAEEYAGYAIDIVTSVPMHRDDLAERGFNSADLLANGVAKHLGKRCDCTVLTKLYKNKKQRSLTESERHGNVLGVYEVTNRSAVKGKTVLLCDDIFTTGATLDECAKMLYFAGADTVLCVCAAITPPPKADKYFCDK